MIKKPVIPGNSDRPLAVTVLFQNRLTCFFYLFMGSERGGKSAAIAYTLIETARLSGVDPQAWFTNVLGRIADHKITKLHELMPWSYAQPEPDRLCPTSQGPGRRTVTLYPLVPQKLESVNRVHRVPRLRSRPICATIDYT